MRYVGLAPESLTTRARARLTTRRFVVTVELSKKYAERAIERFDREMVENHNKAVKRITLLNGDSGQMLSRMPIFEQLGRTLWFLDGHYSYMDTARGDNDSPLMAELQYILDGPRNEGGGGDIIFVDDAREFRGTRFPVRAPFGDGNDGPCTGVNGTCGAPAQIEYPELSDVLSRICEWSPSALVDLERDMLKIRTRVGRVAGSIT